MMSLTQQVRQGAEEAFESMAQGWRELKARAGSALTRFRAPAKPDAGQEPVPFARWAFMAADVVEEDDRIVVRLEAPGLRKEDLEVEVQGSVLSVRGEKRVDTRSAGRGYSLVECAYGAFRRDVPLPVPVQADRANASYRDGVLRIELPKVEGSRPASIRVDVS